MAAKVRVALVHDWLTGMRGGEYVLEAVSEIFKDPEIFTLIAFKESVSPRLASLKTHTSILQQWPGVGQNYRKLLPLLPTLIRQFDLSEFDLILSTSSCVAKGIKRPRNAVHLSYVFAPMRYMWDRFDEYFGPGQAGFWMRFAAKSLRPYLRYWDRLTSQPNNVDVLIGNSSYIRQQIEACYGRKAEVIFSFADLERFSSPRKPEDFFLVVSAFAPYKRIDLAIEAFNRTQKPLWVVGKGQDEQKLRKMAGPSICFLGERSNSEIADLYSRARAFVFPGREDFGITPVEAIASGCPVIAYRAGGVLDTLNDQVAELFNDQSVEGLVNAVEKFEKRRNDFDETVLRKHAIKFSRATFKAEYLALLKKTWVSKQKNLDDLLSVLA